MTGLLLVLCFVALIAISLWSVIDAALQPDQAYAAVGASKGLVTIMLVLTCVIGALVYWPFIRPRLRRATVLRWPRRLRPCPMPCISWQGSRSCSRRCCRPL